MRAIIPCAWLLAPLCGLGLGPAARTGLAAPPETERPILPLDPVTLLRSGPDGLSDLQGFLLASFAAGNKRIVVPPGRYRVAPQRSVHLRFTKWENTEVVMDGVEMVCTETTQAIAISDCRNLRIRGLTIDYDPLPFTQGRITALGPQKEWLEFEVIDGYPDEKLEMRIEIFDGGTGELKCATRYDWQPFEKSATRRYRVRRGPNHRPDPAADLEEVGDILVTNHLHAPGGLAAHTIVSDRCTDLVLQDISVQASNCFSFLENHCDNTTYQRCRLDRRAPTDDPVKRGWMRLRSGNADAFHSISAKRGPQILSCLAAHMGDDGVNIRGHYNMVASSEGPVVRLIAKNKPDLEKGDPIEMMTYEGVRLSDAVLAEGPQPDGTSTPEIAGFFGRQRMNDNIREFLSRPDAPMWKVVANRPVDLPVGSVLGARNRIGSGFVVKDSIFGPNRSRGILIKGSNGEVSGNTCRGNWGSGILVTPEWWWLEAGSSDDLVISGNTIGGCRDTALAITAQAGSGRTAPAGAHNRLRIVNNTIRTTKLPAVRITSVRDGVFQGNTITATSAGEAVILLDNTDFASDGNTLQPPPGPGKIP